MEDKKEVFGKRLKILRKKLGKNQEDIANAIGISRARYSHYENNHVEPDLDLIRKIADYHNVDTDYLLGRVADPTPPNKSEEVTDIKVSTADLNDKIDSLSEINKLLKKYGIDQSGFFDIEKWKNLGPEEIRQLESYFQFIVEESKKKDSSNKD